MLTLALDVSGAATGWAIGVDGKVERYGKFIGKTTVSKGEQLVAFGNWLEAFLKEVSPDVIVIEKPFRGRNSNVLALLSKFVGIVEYVCFKVLGKPIKPEWFISPKTVKKMLGVKKGKDHDANKRIMVRRINQLLKVHLKFVKNKAKGYNDDDVADAIGLLLTWYAINADVSD